MQPDNGLIWKNDRDGNNHTLVHDGTTLKLTVVKPDASTWDSENLPTESTIEEWRSAFSTLGPKWNQVAGAESIKGSIYQDTRYAETATERIEWGVHHIHDETRYRILDTFSLKRKDTSA